MTKEEAIRQAKAQMQYGDKHKSDYEKEMQEHL